MAEVDKVTLNKATIPGGEVVAAETIVTKQVQLIKLLLGAPGVDGGPVSATNPLPATDAATKAAVDLVTAAITALGNGATLADVLAALGSVGVTGPLTDTELRAAAVPISAASLPLPAGAAAEATLAAALAILEAWQFTGGAGSVTLAGGTLTSVADKTPLNNGVVLLLSDVNPRKTILIRSNKANVNKMRIGGADISSTQGIELNPGDTITLETTAAVYAKNLADVTSTVPQKLSIVEVS